MKKAADEPDEIRDEYDLEKLKGRVRGKHHEAVKTGTNLVLLEPDVAKAFPDSAAVNEALRKLAKVTAGDGESDQDPGKKGA